MSRERYLLRGPLMHELLLFIAQPGRRMEEIVISGRHRAAIHDGCNQRCCRASLLHIHSRPVREIQRVSSFLRAEQIGRRKFRTPGAAAAVRMAIEAGVRESFVHLRVCSEAIGRPRPPLHRCRVAATRTSRQHYRGTKRSAETHCEQTEAPNSGNVNQAMHRRLSPNRVLKNRH